MVELLQQQLLVDGAELHVDVAGEGLPLVFVHGLGLQAALWNRLTDALGTGYQLVRVSLRGSPRSRELEQRELTLERWASDVGAVIDALELDRPVLVGLELAGARATAEADAHELVPGAERIAEPVPESRLQAEPVDEDQRQALAHHLDVELGPVDEKSLLYAANHVHLR